MQTQIPAAILATDRGQRADDILRACVHCGFCNATCPTYQIRRDERDGPRGRIYLIKDLLEAGTTDAGAAAQTHLDRCLTCRACETTCPSGVRYGELAEIGREILAERNPARGWLAYFLRNVVPNPRRLEPLVALGRFVRWLLPAHYQRLVQSPPPTVPLPTSGTVMLWQGCVQRVVTPEVNAHLTRLLQDRGAAPFVAEAEECCGGLALHLGHGEQARATMRRNVERLSSQATGDIVSTASGCGVTLKEYGRVLGTPEATAFAKRVRDAAEVLADMRFQKRTLGDGEIRKVAWHPPCTLQHGQRLTGGVERILRATGYELVPVADAHLCCGSAGAYSLLQPELAAELKRRKAAALTQHAPDVVATANIGCQTHLDDAVDVPVVHWLELLK